MTTKSIPNCPGSRKPLLNHRCPYCGRNFSELENLTTIPGHNKPQPITPIHPVPREAATLL